MKRARYHPAARDELRGAIAYDEADRPGRGVDLEGAVRRVIRRVQLLPQSAPRWPRIEAHEIRRAKVKRHPYVVVYAVLRSARVAAGTTGDLRFSRKPSRKPLVVPADTQY